MSRAAGSRTPAGCHGGRCTRETGTACCFCRRRRRQYRTRFREGARRWNSALVNLPDVFAKCYPDELPGRRLFLDYCHLTLDGMHLAMAAAASRVLDLQPQETARIGIAQLLRSVPPVEIPPAVDAAARFFAALYCLRFASTMTPGVVDTESIARRWECTRQSRPPGRFATPWRRGLRRTATDGRPRRCPQPCRGTSEARFRRCRPSRSKGLPTSSR